MDGNEYAERAMRTLNPKVLDMDMAGLCAILGMVGEVGELADLMKKSMFHGHEFDLDHAREELADAAWYVPLMCRALGITLNELFEISLAKVEKRYGNTFSEEVSRARYK